MLLSRGSKVVSVEPQLDLCCALHAASRRFHEQSLTLCGGVKPSSSELETIAVTGGYRYGAVSAGVSQFTRLGLPTPSVVPVYPLQDIIDLMVEADIDHIDFMKIDTDSGDCVLARELLENNINFTTATIEFAGCTPDFNALILAELQGKGYHVYLTSPSVSKSCLSLHRPKNCQEQREEFITGALHKNVFKYTVNLGGANWFVGNLEKKSSAEWKAHLNADPELLSSFEAFATRLVL